MRVTRFIRFSSVGAFFGKSLLLDPVKPCLITLSVLENEAEPGLRSDTPSDDRGGNLVFGLHLFESHQSLAGRLDFGKLGVGVSPELEELSVVTNGIDRPSELLVDLC